MSGKAVDMAGTNALRSEPLGEYLCLDFVNTVDPRGAAGHSDLLATVDELVTWSEDVRTVDGTLAERLRAAASRDTAGAEQALARVRRAREALYRVLRAVAERSPPRATDLRTVSAWIADARAHAELTTGEDGRFVWSWPATPDLARCAWPVAASADSLLTSPLLDRVGICDSRECAWAFLDTSKNRSRRWCRMASCGNPEKTRRYAERHGRR
jgi:predicted RNA-binding Zn ribbon-like protein